MICQLQVITTGNTIHDFLRLRQAISVIKHSALKRYFLLTTDGGTFATFCR